MVPALGKNSRWKQFSLDHDQPSVFCVFLWQSKEERISGYYMAYRFMTAALFLSVLVFCTSRSSHPDYWFIYLSHIGFILQTLHLMVSAAVPVQFLLLSQNGRLDKMPRLARFSWFLYNVTNLLSVLISVVFWAVLFTPAKGLKDRDFLVHGLNCIMSMTDIFVTKRPCNMLHFLQPLAALVPYTVFSIIYWAAGGRRENGLSYIYPILNWENLHLTIPFVLVGLTIGLPLVHCFIWSLHLMRDYLLTRFNERTFTKQKTYQSQWNPAFVLEESCVKNSCQTTSNANPPACANQINELVLFQ